MKGLEIARFSTNGRCCFHSGNDPIHARAVAVAAASGFVLCCRRFIVLFDSTYDKLIRFISILAMRKVFFSFYFLILQLWQRKIKKYILHSGCIKVEMNQIKVKLNWCWILNLDLKIQHPPSKRFFLFNLSVFNEQ